VSQSGGWSTQTHRATTLTVVPSHRGATHTRPRQRSRNGPSASAGGPFRTFGHETKAADEGGGGWTRRRPANFTTESHTTAPDAVEIETATLTPPSALTPRRRPHTRVRRSGPTAVECSALRPAASAGLAANDWPADSRPHERKEARRPPIVSFFLGRNRQLPIIKDASDRNHLDTDDPRRAPPTPRET